MKKALAALLLALPLLASAAEKDPNYCQQLRDELHAVKDAQRRNSTPQLNDRERQIHDEMRKYSCSNFDPK
jgi:hypothetical protein